MANDPAPAAAPSDEEVRKTTLERAIERIIQDACELPDRSSPEDQPEMLLITGEELDMLLRRHLGLEDGDLIPTPSPERGEAQQQGGGADV